MTLEAETTYSSLTGKAWLTAAWGEIGDVWSDRVNLAATSTADLWYTCMVDSDLINKVNSTILDTLSIDLSTPPPGWTTKDGGTLWHPSFPSTPTQPVTTTTTTETPTPSFDLFFSLLVLIGFTFYLSRNRKI